MMKTDWAVVFRVAVVLLLGVMVSCLLNLRCRIEYLEQEIVAVEKRATEREMRLVVAPAKTIAEAAENVEPLRQNPPENVELEAADPADTAAETVVSDCRVAALLAMTEDEKPVLCSVEVVPVVCDTETAMYPWPDEETEYVLRVLTAEAGTDEVLCGCVAQALYNACERYDWAYSPAEMLVKYQYTDPASWVSAEAERAWDEVFCSGVVWDCVGKATVFYAPAYGESAYHESQRFVVEINGVRFFEEVQG